MAKRKKRTNMAKRKKRGPYKCNTKELYWAIMKIRCHIAIATEIRDRLRPGSARSELFKGTCFGPWLDVQCTSNDSSLVHLILQTEYTPKPVVHQDALFFRVGGRELRFGPQEFCLITGMRFGPYHLKHRRADTTFRERVFGHLQAKPKVADLKNVFDHSLDRLSDLDAVRICLLMLVEVGFMGCDPRVLVDKILLELVEDLDSWNKFPWGSYVWKVVHKQLHNALAKRSAGRRYIPVGFTLKGFIWVFKIWIFEVFPYAKRFATKHGGIPRAISWGKNNLITRKGGLPFVTDAAVPGLEPLPVLTPTPAECATDWWQASCQFFDSCANDSSPLLKKARLSSPSQPLIMACDQLAEDSADTTSMAEEDSADITSMPEEDSADTTSMPEEDSADSTSMPEEDGADTITMPEEDSPDTTAMLEEDSPDTTVMPEEDRVDTTTMPEEDGADNTTMPIEDFADTTTIPVEDIADTTTMSVEDIADTTMMPVEDSADATTMPVDDIADATTMPVEDIADATTMPVEDIADATTMSVEDIADTTMMPVEDSADTTTMPVEDDADTTTMPEEDSPDTTILPIEDIADTTTMPEKDSADTTTITVEDIADSTTITVEDIADSTTIPSSDNTTGPQSTGSTTNMEKATLDDKLQKPLVTTRLTTLKERVDELWKARLPHSVKAEMRTTPTLLGPCDHVEDHVVAGKVSSQSDVICVHSYEVKQSVAPILESIIKKHGDIAADCIYKPASMRSSFLETICEVVRQIQTNDDIDNMEGLEHQVLVAEAANINVSWLRVHLDAILKRKDVSRKRSLLMETKANTSLVKKAALTDLRESCAELMAAQERFEKAERCVRVLHLVEKNLNDSILESKGKIDSGARQPFL